ncbi:MAG TPA: hypothetical protein VKZ46_04300 [Pedomonas sp.]|nr:hypothetical protein [Pedomonas sp.]
MEDRSEEELEAGRILARLADALPDASPMAQAFLLMLAQRDEARLAALAKALDLPQALALRTATELAALTDDAGAAIASFTPGRSPGAGLLRLTPDGVLLTKRLLGRTARTDH